MTNPAPKDDHPDALAKAAHEFARSLAEELGTPKPWWLSKGILGALGGIVSAAAGLAGVALAPDQATEILSLVGALAFSLLALLGRAKAQRPIDPRVLPRHSDRSQPAGGVSLSRRAGRQTSRSHRPNP